MPALLLSGMTMQDINGLVTWDERQIMIREQAVARLSTLIQSELRGINSQWQFHRIDAPQLAQRSTLSAQYTNDDIWVLDAKLADEEGALRPETTPSSYAWLVKQLESHNGVKPPVCVWQYGKSFRQEIDQPTKFVRLKEFYQMEFQCVIAEDTQVDYHDHPTFLNAIAFEINKITGRRARIVPSDRLPAYSKRTEDIEVFYAGRWMEVASISLRTDFPAEYKYTFKNEQKSKKLLTFELAFGMDRITLASGQDPKEEH